MIVKALLILLFFCSNSYANTRDGLVHWWKLDDNSASTTVINSAAGGASGTSVGNTNTLSSDGIRNKSFLLNGTSQYIINSSTVNNFVGLVPFTMSAFVYINSLSAQNIFNKWNQSTGSGQYQFDVRSDGSISGYVVRTSYGTARIHRASTTTITTKTWNLLTYTYDGGTSSSALKYYINGIEVSYSGTTDNFGTLSPGMTSTARSFLLGASNTINDSTYTNFLNGYIDDVRVYNRVLTAQEIKDLYNSGISLKGIGTTIKGTGTKLNY